MRSKSVLGIALLRNERLSAVSVVSYDKFQSKTDNHGVAEDALSTDHMLDA